VALSTAEFREIEPRSDGALFNALTKLGTSFDRSTYTRAGVLNLLSQDELNRLYVGSWLCRRVVDLVPSECTRAGWELSLGKETSQAQRNRFEQLVAEGEHLGIRKAVRDGLRLARFQGGAVVVMLADDGLAPEEPLDLKRLRSIKSLYPMDCRRIWPAPGWSGVGTPTLYEFMVNRDEDMSRQGLKEAQTVKIHASRLLRFEGDEVPYDYRSYVNWWGVSVIQSIWEVFKRYETGQQSASAILSDFSLWVHKIKGLGGMVVAGNEEAIQTRLQAAAMSRSILGGIAIDETEEVSFLSRSVAGVHDILEDLKNEIQGASRIPHTKLWGASPSGLGATGRSEDASFAQEVNQWQEDHLNGPLRQFYEVLANCRDSKSRMDLPEGWKIHFSSTFVLNDNEMAELRGKVAQADTQYITAKVLQPHEVAVARFGSPTWTMETNLIDREGDGKIKQENPTGAPPTFGGDLAPPDDTESGAQPAQNQPVGSDQALPGDARGDASIRADACCKPCDDADAQGQQRPCDQQSQEDSQQEEPDAVGQTMHRWKHATLHRGTGQPGEHRAKVPYDKEHHRQAVAIALSIAGQSKRGRGRRRGVRNDGSRIEGRHVVAGVPLQLRSDGTASLLGPYGNETGMEAAVGFDNHGLWEVMDTTTGQWCAVVGVAAREAVESAAGPEARIRPLDGVDLIAMGICCDAYQP
jgi:phage-related protein (TIGR01555 family)